MTTLVLGLLLTNSLVYAVDPLKNVLYIVIDDMRSEINALNVGKCHDSLMSPAYTPNLDKLSSRSMLFTQAYVQYAICAPSRASFLTGRRPDTTGIYNLYDNFRNNGNYTTTMQYFKQQGYIVKGIGKITHPGYSGNYNDPPSWTEPYIMTENYNYSTKYVSYASANDIQQGIQPLPDQQLMLRAREAIQDRAQMPTEPWFLAVGFKKPHLPFYMPEEYLQYYPLEDIALAENPYAPIDMPNYAWTTCGEFRSYDDIRNLGKSGAINESFPDAMAQMVRRYYYATVSYVDDMIGLIIDELDASGMADNTIISVISDHGFILGEHNLYCKHSNFMPAIHIPMMIHVPGETDEGIVVDSIVEAVDLHPTLIEAAGLPAVPVCPVNGSRHVENCHEGQSLMDFINPWYPETKQWKRCAFFQYNRWGDMLYGLRCDNYLFQEYLYHSLGLDFTPDFTNIMGTELYDIYNDPLQRANLANDPSYADVISELHDILASGYHGALQI